MKPEIKQWIHKKKTLVQERVLSMRGSYNTSSFDSSVLRKYSQRYQGLIADHDYSELVKSEDEIFDIPDPKLKSLIHFLHDVRLETEYGNILDFHGDAYYQGAQFMHDVITASARNRGTSLAPLKKSHINAWKEEWLYKEINPTVTQEFPATVVEQILNYLPYDNDTDTPKPPTAKIPEVVISGLKVADRMFEEIKESLVRKDEAVWENLKYMHPNLIVEVNSILARHLDVPSLSFQAGIADMYSIIDFSNDITLTEKLLTDDIPINLHPRS